MYLNFSLSLSVSVYAYNMYASDLSQLRDAIGKSAVEKAPNTLQITALFLVDAVSRSLHAPDCRLRHRVALVELVSTSRARAGDRAQLFGFLRTTVCDRRHKHVFTRSRLTPYCAPLLGVAADAVAAVREHTSPIGAQTKLRCASNAHHTQPNIHRTIEPAPHRPGGATARTGAVIITSAPSTATDDCVLQRAENIDLIYV